MAIYLARNIRLAGMREYEDERELIKREARPVIDKTLEMGDGDVALGTIRAFTAGVLDVPWSPNRGCKGRVMPARDADGYLRILDPGLMPFPHDAMEIHEARLRQRAVREGVEFGHDLAVSSVYEIAEPVANLLSDKWT